MIHRILIITKALFRISSIFSAVNVSSRNSYNSLSVFCTDTNNNGWDYAASLDNSPRRGWLF